MDCAFCRTREAKAGALPGTVAASGDAHVDALLWGHKWDSSSPLTYWFDTGGDTVTVYGSSYSTHAWSATEKAAMRQGLLLWTRLTPLADPAEVADKEDADLKWYLIDEAWFLGAHFGPNGEATQGQGFFNKSGTGWSDLTQGGYGWITVIHELGHALGLAHPHDEGGDSSTFPGVASWWQYGDQRQNQNAFTVMSYLDVGADYNPSSAVNYGFSATPMAYDVAAIQHIYGASTAHNAGDTTYAMPTSHGSYTAIVDTDGTDTLSYSGSADVTIDLRPATGEGGAGGGGYVSKTEGMYGGFTVARGTVVENATGGDGDDTLWGNEADNVLTGGGGSNVILGGDGNDIAHVAAGAAVFKDRHCSAFHAAKTGGAEDVLVQVEGVYVGGAAHALGYTGEKWFTLAGLGPQAGQTVHLKQHGTGGGGMEAHVLGAGGKYFVFQGVTALHHTYGGWQFALHPANANLLCFKLHSNQSNKVEVHEMSYSSNYTKWSLQVETKLESVYHSWQLGVAPNGDVLAVDKASSGSITVLSRSSVYQSSVTYATPVGVMGAHFEMLVAPDNGDVVLIKKRQTSSNSTEMHILSAASHYAQWTLQTATALGEVDGTWHFGMDTARDLWAFKTRNTGCNKTEIHVLSAASAYQQFRLQTCTKLHEL